MQSKIEIIKKIFHLNEHLLEERKEAGLYIESLASLIVDRFYEYLLTDPEFAMLLDKVDIARLKRVRKEFLVSLFNDDFDESLLNKLSRAHSDIPFRISKHTITSAFSILQDSIIDIASVNATLQKNLKIVLKFLDIASFIIQEDFEQNKEILHGQNIKVTIIDALSLLFEMLTIHKNKNAAMVELFKSNKLRPPYGAMLPIAESKDCSFSELLEQFESQFIDLKFFHLDIINIKQLHEKYHDGVKQLYKLVQSDTDATKEMEKLQKISTELFQAIGKPFEDSSSITFLSIKSGMQFLQQFNTAVDETKYIPFNNPKKMLIFTQELITNTLKSSMQWAIAEIKITQEKQMLKQYEFSETIIFSDETFYIAINLKNIAYKKFLLDVLGLFLKLFKTTLINREKEYTLLKLADKAESANRAKDMFLSNMSHELRTPLNAIIGFSQILKTKQDIPSNLRPYIDKISIAGNNLLNLVNTILDFAKIEAGKISYHPKMTLAADILHEVFTMTSILADAKNIQINFPNDISLALYVDPQLIKQVLLNIFSNAIKFTPNGGKITLDIQFDGINKEFILSICDTGVGMSQEGISKLFTPFTQLENDLQSASKGTGLGLVITKRIVEDLHQGRIWVESEVGKGSCFYITIPISDAVSTVAILPSKQKHAPNLLVVEDTQEYADILINKLNPTHNITLTNSVVKAQELLSKNSYDKIILDFFLVDGISADILSFMDEQKIETPAIIISAEDDIKLVDYIGAAENVVGIFNKKDIESICSILKRGTQITPQITPQ
ncbi:ATP-binding protein [Sulfurimonas sp.]|uniref:ATP-binding protein n=1 Tax=Sulfurimonas sp. TaxID=2022749 RepID=UPI00260015A5|nr:ATP-binding protein [Sulfurimonas sp.]MBW6487851.1 hypothetical protein [Sulfurimonas sp.]